MKLLGPEDPPVCELVNFDSDFPVVLVCEHAGRAVPKKLQRMGLTQDAMARHIAWDIGAAALTRKIAKLMGAPAILQNFSRLVIDCNRPPEHPSSMPAISDETLIPANAEISQQERAARIDEVFTPFQSAVCGLLDQHERKVALAIHSFTPVLAGAKRPWDISFLFRQDTQTSKRLAAHISHEELDLCIGMNQPYNICDKTDWFVPRHGEKRGLAHSLVEIRNDHLLTNAGQDYWAGILTRAITQYLKEIQ